MATLPAILFPHSHITVPELRNVLSVFERLVVYQPWFMGAPLPPTQRDFADAVHVRYPPAHLKPKPGFKELLSEYGQWIRHNQDRGYAAFLQATQDAGLSETTRWEIGAMIRRMNEELPGEAEIRALKWHLTLHLAREILENRQGEAEILKEIKRKASPLKAALEDETSSEGLLADLPHMAARTFFEEQQLAKIVEAWFGLFGGTLPNRAELVTTDPQVMSWIKGITDDIHHFDSKKDFKSTTRKDTEGRFNIIRYQIPPLKRERESAPDLVLTGLSQKTIVLFGEQS